MNGTKYANMLIMSELSDTETRLKPFGVLNQLRDKTPVRYDESRGCWDVFRYVDVHRILKDPHTFSSRRGCRRKAYCLWILPSIRRCGIW
ncbi:hypothetical protein LJK88_35350 [Paenibacillus sp. P26]|nr:hypothetical protein LJK88_35350 [Paenibacillus sp. P26]UUZ93680.1 hypothetical protein LJK87_02845 [Paenibacillus sp. P25]